MRSAVIRKLVSLFEAAFKVNMEEDYKVKSKQIMNKMCSKAHSFDFLFLKLG
jgi:hypothetical protein